MSEGVLMGKIPTLSNWISKLRFPPRNNKDLPSTSSTSATQSPIQAGVLWIFQVQSSKNALPTYFNHFNVRE